MTIEASEVPDTALDALMEAAPRLSPGEVTGRDGLREGWRQALAVALTAWESARPAAVPVYARGHECAWRVISVFHRDVLLGVKQTDVAMKCDGCGDLTSRTLNGTVTLNDLRA